MHPLSGKICCLCLFVFLPLIIILFHSHISWAAVACNTDNCRQIETIRERHNAKQYSFADPNYNVRIGQLLWALDYYTSYFESRRKYYTPSDFNATIEGLRQQYLTALNGIVSLGTYTGPQDKTNGNGGAAQAGGGATKRIVVTTKSGKRYGWQFVPPATKRAGRIIAEGRLQ